MAKAFIPQAVTANRLRVGDVVYLAADESWTPNLGEAAVAADADRLAALEGIAARDAARQLVVAVYPIDVDTATGVPQPVSVKERIRAARGPSV
jgi:Protein of unknown function (DUF2849)